MNVKARVRRWGPPGVVWGMGGVRLAYAGGPEDEPGNFGDQLSPILLLDAVYPDLVGAPTRYPVSVVPHYVDLDDPMVHEVRRKHPTVHVIDVLDRPRAVAEQIAASGFVLSSSLHGLIAAEALGVPNRWTPLSDKVIGGGYKFHDYYSAFGVEPAPLDLLAGVELALAGRLRSMPLPDWRQRQRELRAAYPGSTVGIR